MFSVHSYVHSTQNCDPTLPPHVEHGLCIIRVFSHHFWHDSVSIFTEVAYVKEDPKEPTYTSCNLAYKENFESHLLLEFFGLFFIIRCPH